MHLCFRNLLCLSWHLPGNIAAGKPFRNSRNKLSFGLGLERIIAKLFIANAAVTVWPKVLATTVSRSVGGYTITASESGFIFFKTVIQHSGEVIGGQLKAFLSKVRAPYITNKQCIARKYGIIFPFSSFSR